VAFQNPFDVRALAVGEFTVGVCDIEQQDAGGEVQGVHGCRFVSWRRGFLFGSKHHPSYRIDQHAVSSLGALNQDLNRRMLRTQRTRDSVIAVPKKT
jgi:hypothetical protein